MVHCSWLYILSWPYCTTFSVIGTWKVRPRKTKKKQEKRESFRLDTEVLYSITMVYCYYGDQGQVVGRRLPWQKPETRNWKYNDQKGTRHSGFFPGFLGKPDISQDSIENCSSKLSFLWGFNPWLIRISSTILHLFLVKLQRKLFFTQKNSTASTIVS